MGDDSVDSNEGILKAIWFSTEIISQELLLESLILTDTHINLTDLSDMYPVWIWKSDTRNIREHNITLWLYVVD